jgi:hypothetical protein
MQARQIFVRCILVITGTLLLSGLGIPVFAVNTPSLASIKSVAEKHWQENPDYSPGDLISRGDVEAIFNELLDRGFPVNDIAEGLYDDFVPENSFLAQTLRTEKGRDFMRKVHALPRAYDRLERLSWIPAGQEILRELVEKPDGATLFKAMLEPDGLKATAAYLASDPRGKNYALPTGHIHTAAQFYKRLEEKYPQGKKTK